MSETQALDLKNKISLDNKEQKRVIEEYIHLIENKKCEFLSDFISQQE